MTSDFTLTELLPTESEGRYLGRVWDGQRNRPVPVLFRDECLWDASGIALTVSELLETDDLLAKLDALTEEPATWKAEDLQLEDDAKDGSPHLLSPVDLQVIKACGVTFADSMVERVIEERAGGDPRKAAEVRAEMQQEVGVDLSEIKPGSEAAATLREALNERGWWSQYLEVGLGPDPEVFTKAAPLSTVGSGAQVGIPRFSSWNNPEPELVLIVNSTGTITGVTLGNDVNLRDVEGRSALLLGMAKDNNRSAALGPFIRLFDDGFSMDEARRLEIELSVRGPEGYSLEGLNSVGSLSRSFEELVGAAWGEHHQYPDGFALYTGTLFAPTEDRDVPGEGFTHKAGDIVRISNPRLGALVNRVGPTEELPGWTYGIGALLRDLRRG